MPDQLTEEKWPETIKMMLIWGAVILLLITIFFPSSYVYKNAEREIGWGKIMIGKTDFVKVVNDSNALYQSLFVVTGVEHAMRDFYTIKENDLASEGGPLSALASLFRNMAENLNYWLYMMVYRIILQVYWLPYMLIVIIPSVFAGIMRWQAKRYSFSYSSPFLNRRSMHLIAWGIYFVFLSIIIPFPMPPMINSVILIVLIPTGTSLLISNLPKRI